MRDDSLARLSEKLQELGASPYGDIADSARKTIEMLQERIKHTSAENDRLLHECAVAQEALAESDRRRVQVAKELVSLVESYNWFRAGVTELVTSASNWSRTAPDPALADMVAKRLRDLLEGS